MSQRQSTADRQQPVPRSAPSRIELALLTVVVAAGIGLRFAFPHRMAVEHFDEGVYASNFWFGGSDGDGYPFRHLYAPPLLPWLIEWSILLWGTGPYGVMLVSLAAGSATVLLAWWTGRSWFGPQAGLAAAVLAAFSDTHLLYSRAALTDVLFCFWLLSAVHLAWSALRRPYVRSVLAGGIVLVTLGAAAAAGAWSLRQNEQLRQLPTAWALAALSGTFAVVVAALWLRTRRLPASLLAGIVAGLAWCTKYNGWLPVAIAAAGLLLWVIVSRPGRNAVRPLLAGLGWMAAAAWVVWTPVLIDLQLRGGFAAVAENHRRYLVGISGWPTSLVRQLAGVRHFDGWLTIGSLLLAALVAAGLARRRGNGFTWNAGSVGDHDKPAPAVVRSTCLAAASLLLSAFAAVAGSAVAFGVLALFGIAVTRRADPAAEESKLTLDDRRLAGCLLAAWFLGLLVATPFYRPYPRLMLPWLMASWLGTAAAVSWATGGSVSGSLRSRLAAELSQAKRTALVLSVTCLLVAVPLFALSAGRLTRRGVAAWQPRDDLKHIAGSMTDDVARNVAPAEFGRVRLFVYGEPALFYHFSAANRPEGPFALIAPTADVRFPQLLPGSPPVLLVFGPHAQRSPHFNEQWNESRNRFRHVGSRPYRPSDMVLLNHYAPRQLAGQHRPRDAIRLYRLVR